MKKYLNILLSSLALIAVALLVVIHIDYQGWHTVLYAFIAVIIGYWFGMWTCHFHKKQKGFLITVVVFSLLNLLHSMIDGASTGGFTSYTNAIAILSHEFARQPALYIVLWGMITPFVIKRHHRVLIVLVTVTGVWLVGVALGRDLYLHISRAPWLGPIADQALFLFLGDLIHHIYEEYRKLFTVDACCHDHA